MNIDELTLAQLKEIRGALGTRAKKAESLPFQIGESILIRTVTMIQVGRVKAIGSDFVLLEDAGWVAETGRFSTMLETGSLSEFERAPSWVMVGRGAIVDVYPWAHALPKTTK